MANIFVFLQDEEDANVAPPQAEGASFQFTGAAAAVPQGGFAF